MPATYSFPLAPGCGVLKQRVWFSSVKYRCQAQGPGPVSLLEKSFVCLTEETEESHLLDRLEELGVRDGCRHCRIRWHRSISRFSRSVVSDSLWPHGLQHARPPCPSPTPGVYWHSCLSSWWCHPAISSSVVPFSRLQSFPASGSFPMSQFFTSGAKVLA